LQFQQPCMVAAIEEEVRVTPYYGIAYPIVFISE
jgi:hypothetical protein